jgi:hypothetical protein
MSKRKVGKGALAIAPDMPRPARAVPAIEHWRAMMGTLRFAHLRRSAVGQISCAIWLSAAPHEAGKSAARSSRRTTKFVCGFNVSRGVKPTAKNKSLSFLQKS